MNETYSIASVWVCLTATEHWAGVQLRAAPSKSRVHVNGVWVDHKRTRGRVVLCAGKASEGRGGYEKGGVVHFESGMGVN